MPGFREDTVSSSGLSKWTGDPDDDAAHRTILAWLKEAVTSGFLGPSESLSNRMKGNLGEFIAYRIGRSYVFTNVELADTANSWDPLSDISRPDIDIVWLHFGSVALEDWAAIQEVKTTGHSSLSLADDLITDYDKLFGENLKLTLQTRLGGLKNKLEEKGRKDLVPRVTALGGPTPGNARGIRLAPTLLHDAQHDSTTKMYAVRQALLARGWSSDIVQCWSIALDAIDSRLNRIARGEV